MTTKARPQTSHKPPHTSTVILAEKLARVKPEMGAVMRRLGADPRLTPGARGRASTVPSPRAAPGRGLFCVLSELHLRGVAVDRREFDEFMDAISPLVMPEGDSAAWWADAYLEATTGQVTPPRVIVV